MDKVINFSDNQPHLTILLIDGNILVISARAIEELINEKLTLEFDNEILIKSIIKEWYENVEYKSPGK